MDMTELAPAALAFGKHLLTGTAFLLAFVLIYTRITPHKEFELIKAGNGAAAVALGGATLGFAIALSTAISVSGSLVEAAVWATIALMAQLLTLFVVRLAIPDLFDAITEGNWAPALSKASLAIAVGLINAASMVP
jgi:putative membrane protein